MRTSIGKHVRRATAWLKTARMARGIGLALGTSVLLVLLMLLLCRVTRPDLATKPEPPSEEEIRKVKALRDSSFDRENPLVLVKTVDYSEGKRAAWYPGNEPENEPRILRKLVAQGKLPPVEERVGSEPAVVEGVDGIGKYGGTWFRATPTPHDREAMLANITYCKLTRLSPFGYPIVPHIAKSWTVSEGSRVFTFKLRKGMRWSDGALFTADDVLFWWKNEVRDESVNLPLPDVFKTRGKTAHVVKIDSHTVKVKFAHPNGVFLLREALGYSPKHYLMKYHPRLGDEELIRREMAARHLESRKTLYINLRNPFKNPLCPALTPWILRTAKATPPHTYVRNPYFWMVDTRGNQLPYIDRIVFDMKGAGLIAISASRGELSMQQRNIKFKDYSFLMAQRAKGGYEVYHWIPGSGSAYCVGPNLNLGGEKEKTPEIRLKAALFDDKRFRQALSLAINRQEVIDLVYFGLTKPAQAAPARNSPFYHEGAYIAFTEYDPDRANALLDEVGLSARDAEGYRTLPDGQRLTLLFDVHTITGEGPSLLLVKYWRGVGLRVNFQMRNRGYCRWLSHSYAMELTTTDGGVAHLPMRMAPAEYAHLLGYQTWYREGGLFDNTVLDRVPKAIEPPVGHPIRRVYELYEEAKQHADLSTQKEIMREAYDIMADNCFTISVCSAPPAIVIVKNGMKNVPRKAVSMGIPGMTWPETYFFEDPEDSYAVRQQIQQEILTPTLSGDAAAAAAATQPGDAADTGGGGRGIVRTLLVILLVLVIVLVSVRHPYIGRRLLITVPMLLVISVIVFTVIQLPPGDFITLKIEAYEMMGQKADLEEMRNMREMFYMDDPWIVRYSKWMGFEWFGTLEWSDEFPFLKGDPAQEGLLQGNMGRGMESLQSVNPMVWDRLLFTFLISLGTILLTWIIALPVGIYSAVRQYSAGDYVLTFIGFIGMCIPSFLLALVVIHFAYTQFDINVSGLFSPEYAGLTGWTWPKVVDLLKHIWLPVGVLGVTGTAGMIRVMRANLLDELRKPYVTTARAKGMRPIRLLLKYPVRIALNPFISGIGGILPALLSGSSIVAIMMSLPTIGPMQYNALMNQDMYLAGSMLMLYSLLGIIGTLVSDLLLLALDPRIRYRGGSR